ncbi:hypothetical protein QE389_000223 [Brevundimonas sp. SORGH_AS 993]|nr:hypothetical protein [Brevundimonas sp. SORGH_AS_0993]
MGPAPPQRAAAQHPGAGRFQGRPVRDSGRGQSGRLLAGRRRTRRDGGGLLRRRRRQDPGSGAGHGRAGQAGRVRCREQASGEHPAPSAAGGRRGGSGPDRSERRRSGGFERTGRSGAGRCPLFRLRHLAPSPRGRLASDGGRGREAARSAGPYSGPGRQAGEAGRASGLCHLFDAGARERGQRRSLRGRQSGLSAHADQRRSGGVPADRHGPRAFRRTGDHGARLRLSPASADTDGFFVALYERKA